MQYVIGIIFLVFAAIWLLEKIGILHPWNESSPQEVQAILSSFISGNKDAWAYDDFVSVRIKDPKLDAVRKEFYALAESYPSWLTDQPFPAEGTPALKALIAKLDE